MQTTKTIRNSENRPVLVALIGICLLVVWFITRPVDVAQAASIESFLAVTLATLNTLSLYLVSREFEYKRVGLWVLGMSLGFLLWAIAEGIWFYYGVNSMDPFPSPADLLWIAGYIPMIIVLTINDFRIKVRMSGYDKVVWGTIMAVASLAVVALSGSLLLEDQSLETMIVVTYVVLDLAVLAPSTRTLTRFRFGQIARPWTLLAIGFVATAIGDILYAYAERTGLYGTAYNVTDLFLLIGYLVVLAGSLSFLSFYRSETG